MLTRGHGVSKLRTAAQQRSLEALQFRPRETSHTPASVWEGELALSGSESSQEDLGRFYILSSLTPRGMGTPHMVCGGIRGMGEWQLKINKNLLTLRTGPARR